MRFLVSGSVTLGLFLLLHTPGGGLAAEEELSLWKKHNCLKDEKSFQMDWAADGQGRVRIETGGNGSGPSETAAVYQLAKSIETMMKAINRAATSLRTRLMLYSETTSATRLIT